MAVLIQSGARYCGIGFYGAADADWNLMGTSGDRTWAIDIEFDEEFDDAPSVNPHIMAFNILDGCSKKLGVGVTDVTTTGFQLQINTWDDTQIGGVAVGWIAYTN